MPQLSKRIMNRKVEGELLESLEYVFTHSKSPEIKKILLSLMTRTERLMIAKRLGVVMLLEDAIPHSTIDDVLKITRATISKMELLVQTRPEGFALALKKLGQRKTRKELKRLLLQVAAYGVSAAGGRLPRRRGI